MAQTNKKTLYVGGLDEQVTEAILKAAFIPFGDIVDVIVPLDHNSQKHRGFGFVEFELPGDAAAALENMNESELFGKVLHCNLAKPTQVQARNKPVWAEAEFYDKKEGEEGSAEGSAEGKAEDKDKEMADAPAATTTETKE